MYLFFYIINYQHTNVRALKENLLKMNFFLNNSV